MGSENDDEEGRGWPTCKYGVWGAVHGPTFGCTNEKVIETGILPTRLISTSFESEEPNIRGAIIYGPSHNPPVGEEGDGEKLRNGEHDLCKLCQHYEREERIEN